MMLLVSGSTRSVARLGKLWPQRLGHLLTPNNWGSIKAMQATGLMWAADNAAFSSFDPSKYQRMLNRIRGVHRCLFVVAPDIVGNASATIDSFLRWQGPLQQCGQPVAFVLQDGQEDLELPPSRWYQAVFIGGTTKFKLSAASAELAEEAKFQGKWVHMGRVNSKRRMESAASMGCDSVDGSSASMFGDTWIPRYMKWLEHIDNQKLMAH